MTASVLRLCRGCGFGRRLVGAAGFATLHDGGAQAVGDFIRQIVEFVAAIDIDGFAGGVDDDLAVVAGAEVLFDLGEQVGVDSTVEIIG